jgi:long-chain acyl-CoA synthetase
MFMENRVIASNLAELYRGAAEQYGELPAFATRHKSFEWEPVSFRELYERGLKLATALIDLGVEVRDHVGLFGDNRFEWILADYGVQLCGAADVPRGRDVTDDELTYIINHAHIQVAFVETEALQKRLFDLKPELPQLKKLILLDPEGKTAEGVHSLQELLVWGETLRKQGDKRAEERIEGIQPEDLFTLIYTSGTTGKPKGVMLTHANMISQMKAIPIELNCTDRVLSLLPVWHIFERVFEMYTICCGVCTYYTNIRTLGDDMKNIEPTFMGSAPRLWESLHQRILKRISKAHPMRRLLFYTAYFLSRQYKASVYFWTDSEVKFQPASKLKQVLLYPLHLIRWLIVLPWYGFFNAAVLEPIRLSAGGSLKATISGGGALPEEIDQFFNYIGIPVLEGYGMTETSPVIAARTLDNLVIGTVGPLVPETEMQIVDIDSGQVYYPDQNDPHNGRGKRGEIWVKGLQIMKGYYREPEMTNEAIRDGWLRTGDLGMMTFNDCLKILGRSKATIVLSSGENLEPELIEMHLNQSPFIEHSMVVGEDRKHLGVLIVPSLEEFRDRGIAAESLEKLVKNGKVEKTIRSEIEKSITTAKGFKRHELIRDFRLLHENFEIGVELTSLFKVKRHVIREKYADKIEEMYSPEPVKAKA